MTIWADPEELRGHLRSGAGHRYAGRDQGASRDIARMLSPWRRGPRPGGSAGPDAVARQG